VVDGSSVVDESIDRNFVVDEMLMEMEMMKKGGWW